MSDAQAPVGEVVDLVIVRARMAKPATSVTCEGRYAGPVEAEPHVGPIVSRLTVALALRGVDPSDLATDFVGWHAIDVLPDRRRAGFPWRAEVGPLLQPIDASRLAEILAGAMPTEGEAATLSAAMERKEPPPPPADQSPVDAIVDAMTEPDRSFSREFFRRPPLPATTVRMCGADEEAACACGAPATLLCDEVTGEGREGTCDAAVCAGCAIEVRPDEHRCPKHRPAPRLSDAPWMGPAGTNPRTKRT